MASKRPAKRPARGGRPTPIPTGFPAITAHLVVADVKRAAETYAKAFGFSLMGPMMKAGRQVIHATLGHAGSAVTLGCATSDNEHVPPAALGQKATSIALYVYVKDVDAHHRRVKRFKGLAASAPVDTFWGDRVYDVVDRDGHFWTFASRKSSPSLAQMKAALDRTPG